MLITGANRGIGLEFARQYAADGWRVLATCRQPERAQELRALGPAVGIHRLDVTDASAIAALRTALEDETIDVFIANAGIMGALPGVPPEEIDQEGWLQAFRINTVAPLACAMAFLSHVARSRERKMLAISSWIGSIGSNTAGGHYVYRSTKSALNAVWRSFALDHPQVIAAVLSPGAVRTDMTRYDNDRWGALPEPAEHVAGLRTVIAGLTQAHSGRFFHFNGDELPW